MAPRKLSSDLSSLIYQIELHDTEWRENLTDKLIISVLFEANTTLTCPEIRHRIADLYGLDPTDETIRRRCDSLDSRDQLIPEGPNGYTLSHTTRVDVNHKIRESHELEAYAKEYFASEAVNCGFTASHQEGLAYFDTFYEDLLIPLVQDLGAKTFQVVTGDTDVDQSNVYSDYIERFEETIQSTVNDLAISFLSSDDHRVRSFILRILDSHLITRAAGLSEESLQKLDERTSGTVQLAVFIDTNFLFSILDLHENSANRSAKDLLDISQTLSGRVNVTLYFLPITKREATSTLSYYETKLEGLSLTPKMGTAASKVGRNLSGITKRFVDVARRSEGRITPSEYLDPYINNLVPITKDHGVEIYNHNLDSLASNQEVIDDIEKLKTIEDKKENGKGYDQIRHDVLMWHFINNKRPDHVNSPRDAEYWCVTLDYGLTRFDRHKTDDNSIPRCVQPGILINMLQFWIPRSEKVDIAKIHSLRSFLPNEFDTKSERITINILKRLSRYENIDDLSEDAIASILVNGALRNRISESESEDEEQQMIHDAILNEFDEARKEAQRKSQEAHKLQSELRERENKLRRDRKSVV